MWEFISQPGVKEALWFTLGIFFYKFAAAVLRVREMVRLTTDITASCFVLATNFYISLQEVIEELHKKESISKEVYMHSTSALDSWYKSTTIQIEHAAQTKFTKEGKNED